MPLTPEDKAEINRILKQYGPTVKDVLKRGAKTTKSAVKILKIGASKYNIKTTL